MVFALLIAAIIWNLGTWYFGLPASSSHTLIGSIIGVGIANQLMSVKTGTSGVDWAQATNIGKISAAFAARWICWRGATVAVLRKRLIPNKRTLRSSQGDRAASILDSRPAGPDLHRRELCARFERRPEGHGVDHAHSDRHGADGLCREPCRDGPADAGLRRRIDTNCGHAH